MRHVRKSRSERKQALREKYRKDRIIRQHILADEEKSGKRRRKKGKERHRTESKEFVARSRRVGNEYYKAYDSFGNHPDWPRVQQTLAAKWKKRIQKVKRVTRPIRRVGRWTRKGGKKMLKQGIYAPSTMQRMLEDDFQAEAAMQKGMVHILRKMAGLMMKAIMALVRSVLHGFLAIFGPIFGLMFLLMFFMFYIINWSPYSYLFALVPGGGGVEAEDQANEVFRQVENRIRFQTVKLLQENQQEGLKIKQDELEEDITQGAVIVIYAMAAQDNISGYDLAEWVKHEGQEKVDDLASDVVYLKRNRIRYRKLSELKELEKYADLREYIETFEEIFLKE